MALASDDLLLVQSGGALKKVEVQNLQSSLSSGDLLLCQRVSGFSSNNNLRKVDWANIGNLQNTDMFVACDVDDNNTLKKTTWSEIVAFLTSTATILASNNGTASNRNLTLDSLFTPAQLALAGPKIINIESGAIVGSNNSSNNLSAINVTSANTVNGTITINNSGTIVGRQGGLHSIHGGTAISFSHNATVVNNGTISGGGGKGGDGGQGGQGQTTNTGASQLHIMITCDQACINDFGSGAFCSSTTQWCSSLNCLYGLCSPCNSYYTVSACNQTWPYVNCTACTYYSYTAGGTGGAGGFGAGFTSSNTNVSNSSGSSGSSPGGNAGAGGQGGAGGFYGQAGFAGTSGSNGNYTNGSSGTTPGNAGVAIAKLGSTVTVTNNGTINGSITP